MKKKVFHYIKEILLFIVVMSIFANILSFYKSRELNKSALDLSAVTLINQKLYHFENNKPLMIHFWATWCPTCKLEVDNIQRVSRYYNVVTFAVKSGSNKELQHYMQERNLNFHVVNDDKSHYSQSFHIAGFPTTFIYDKNQNLRFSEVGYTSSLGLYLRLLWAEYL